MKVFARGLARVAASYAAVVLVIILMPIFLITNDVSILDSLKDFIFGKNG